MASKSYLKIFFDYAYLVGFSPFRLELSAPESDNDFQGSERQSHERKTWKYQKVICGISHCLGSTVLFTEAVKHVNHVRKQKTPSAYFHAFYGINNFFMSIIAARLVWRKQKLIRRLADETFWSNNTPQIKVWMFLLVHTACITGILLSTASLIVGTGFFPSQKWTPSYWWASIVQATRSRLLGYETVDADSLDLSEVPVFHKILAVLLIIASFFRFINRLFLELLLLIGILSFWVRVHSFAKDVDEDEELQWNWKRVLRKYRFLKQFSKKFNQIFSGFVFFYVWHCVLLYSTRLDTLFAHDDEFFRWRGLYFYAASILIFLFAADCCHKAQSVQRWLHRNKLGGISNSAMALLCFEVSQNKVAVTGLGIMSVTYGFVANVAGLVVTYFIICVEPA